MASFNNETDALEILANAATDPDGDSGPEKSEQRADRGKHVAWADDAAPRPLSDFVLISRGILDERQLEQLVDQFFTHRHAVLVSCRSDGR